MKRRNVEMMKRPLTYIIIGIALLLSSCGAVHTSDNGMLDGFWQLTAVDTLATGGTTDMRQSQVTWAVQGTILEVRKANSIDKLSDIMFAFDHHDDLLLLRQPYVIDRDKGDVPVVDVELLKPFGISRLEPLFRVLRLNSYNMTLESDDLRLHFRSY